jgi:hypothetical protein
MLCCVAHTMPAEVQISNCNMKDADAADGR